MKKRKAPRGDGNSIKKSIFSFSVMFMKKRKTPRGDGNKGVILPLLTFTIGVWKREKPQEGTVTQKVFL